MENGMYDYDSNDFSLIKLLLKMVKLYREVLIKTHSLKHPKV